MLLELLLLLLNFFSVLAQYDNLKNSPLKVCMPQVEDVGGMKNRVFSNGEQNIACRYGFVASTKQKFESLQELISIVDMNKNPSQDVLGQIFRHMDSDTYNKFDAVCLSTFLDEIWQAATLPNMMLGGVPLYDRKFFPLNTKNNSIPGLQLVVETMKRFDGTISNRRDWQILEVANIIYGYFNDLRLMNLGYNDFHHDAHAGNILFLKRRDKSVSFAFADFGRTDTSGAAVCPSNSCITNLLGTQYSNSMRSFLKLFSTASNYFKNITELLIVEHENLLKDEKFTVERYFDSMLAKTNSLFSSYLPKVDYDLFLKSGSKVGLVYDILMERITVGEAALREDMDAMALNHSRSMGAMALNHSRSMDAMRKDMDAMALNHSMGMKALMEKMDEMSLKINQK